MKAIRCAERSRDKNVNRIVFVLDDRPGGTPSDIEHRFRCVLEAAGLARTAVVFQDNPRAYKLIVSTSVDYTDRQLEKALAAAL